MKVLFISRSTLYTGNGGDTVQIVNTAARLRKLGVAVDIALCNDLNIDYSQYHLIHYFNIIRPADIIYHIDKSKLPFVVSPIYLEYKDQTELYKQGMKDKLLAMFSKHTREYIKCIARYIRNGEAIVSKKYLYLGHRKSIEYILERALYLLPNSHSEYNRLKMDFAVAGAYAVIPNAVDLESYYISEEDISKKSDKTVLCIARFEPRKNQLNLIKALKQSDYKLSFAGNVAPNHQSYYQQCLDEAGEGVRFHNFVDQQEVVALFREHKVHVLPSWFETTGLSSLEAAACGCNVVITKNGDTEEYFSNDAFYCDPGNNESIKMAVDKAMSAKSNPAFIEKIKAQYNWNVTAKNTLEVYQKVINK